MVGAASSSDPYTVPELPGYRPGNQNYGGRTQVSAALVGGESTAVILTLGDSLISNTVNSLYTVTQAKHQNFNVYNGGLYSAAEPLLGCQTNAANLSSGCFFSRACDTLIANAVYARVIHAPVTVGGSLLVDHAAGGAINGRIGAAYRRLAAAGLPPTAVYVMCGANDKNAGVTEASATASLNSIIATIRTYTACKIFIAKHSNFGLATSAAIQNAQVAVLSAPGLVFSGGDMDSLAGTAGNYWDNTHFNATGAAAAAALAVAAITANP